MSSYGQSWMLGYYKNMGFSRFPHIWPLSLQGARGSAELPMMAADIPEGHRGTRKGRPKSRGPQISLPQHVGSLFCTEPNYQNRAEKDSHEVRETARHTCQD